MASVNPQLSRVNLYGTIGQNLDGVQRPVFSWAIAKLSTSSDLKDTNMASESEAHFEEIHRMIEICTLDAVD